MVLLLLTCSGLGLLYKGLSGGGPILVGVPVPIAAGYSAGDFSAGQCEDSRRACARWHG